MKLEFSRISDSRACALTLVIDEENGAPTRVSYCLSKRRDPEDAICDLRCREGTTNVNIDRLSISDDGPSPRHPGARAAIRSWAPGKRLDVVVWTGLQSNFAHEKGQPFSVPAAIAHVQSLSPEGKAKAAEYVWRASKFVDTPVRRALQAEPWFLPPRS